MDNIEDDYFLYLEGNKVIIQGIKNPSYKKEVQTTYNGFKENDIIYFSKSNGENIWRTYKIEQENSWTEIQYQAHQLNDLTEENFVNSWQTLDVFVEPKIAQQAGFIMNSDNNGLLKHFQTEQLHIQNRVISFLNKQPRNRSELFQRGRLRDNTSATIRRLLREEIKEGLYSLEIENGKIKIKDIKSDSENIVFEQELSENKKTEWNDKSDNDKYQKMYFTKDPNNDHLVKKWIINDNPHELQSIGTVNLSELRTYFANDNLFYNPNQCNGFLLGENGRQAAANAAQQAAVTKLPPVSPVSVNNVINLKWNNSMALWNLNVTTAKSTLDKKIKFEENENQILNDLIVKNNNANTVILFNKNDGKFLGAYYFDQNNKKINCSNKLTNSEKENLNVINQKAKKRIKEPTTVNPKCYVNTNIFSKDTKTFNLSIVNRKWYVLCEDEIGMQVKAEIPLATEEISALSNLVKGAIDIKVTFDMENNFKEIKYIDFTKKQDITIAAKNLSNNSANGINIDNSELMEICQQILVLGHHNKIKCN